MGAATVAELVSALGSAGLTVIGGDPTRELRSGLCTIHDPVVPSPSYASGLLLAVGVGTDAMPELIDHAAASGFDAVVGRSLRRHPFDAARMVEAAATTGIAVLDLEGPVPWGQLEKLIAAATRRRDEGGMEAAEDFFEIATVIAQMTGGATTIEDVDQRLVGYSAVKGQPIDDARRSAILGRRADRPPEATSHYERAFRARGHLEVRDLPTSMDRLVCAVRVADEVLGYIWVIDGGGLQPHAGHLLERAAEIVAVRMMTVRQSVQKDRDERAELTRQALSGASAARDAVIGLGWPPEGPFAVLAFVHPEQDRVGGSARFDRFFSSFVSYVSAWRPSAGWFRDHEAMYVVVDTDLAANVERTEYKARLVVERAASFSLPLHVGIGSVVTSPEEIAQSRDEAVDLARLGQRCTGSQVTQIDQHRSTLSLLRIGRLLQDDPRVEFAPILRLRQIDEHKGTELCRSWQTWFEHGGDVGAAAADLLVHPNTLRYRLRRAAELSGLPSTPDASLLAWLGLRVTEPSLRAVIDLDGRSGRMVE